MKKGISLIVLVITIIVMIVIASTVMIAISNSGILTKALESAFKSDVKAYMTEYELYAADYILSGGNIGDIDVAGDEIHNVIPAIKVDLEYKDKFSIKKGVLMYTVDNKDEEDVQRATWACEVGMKVEGAETCSDIEYIEIHQTSYKETNGVYYNTPDITGYNLSMTYFVTYDVDGNGEPKIGTNLTKKAPSNWHDYGAQKWANIVVIDEEKCAETYLTWIPRYAYKVDKNKKIVDVKFISVNNEHIDSQGNKIIYNETEPIFDEEGNQTNYIVASAFTLDVSDDESFGGKEKIELAGFWTTKYELSLANTLDIKCDALDEEIIVWDCFSTSDSNKYTYEYYLNNELKLVSSEEKYTYTELIPETTYDIKIIQKSGDAVVAQAQKTVTTSGTPSYGEPNAPELTGFNLAMTYYVTWDEEGNPIKDPIKIDGVVQEPPEGWYDYSAQKWANIVVIDSEKNAETYLTWIPRYEYRVLAASNNSNEKTIDISFIPTTQVEPTFGYIIGSAFTLDVSDDESFGGKKVVELPGFWTTKYELSVVE